MTYTCSKNILNGIDKQGNVVRKFSENQMIDIINREFGLKGTVTKLILK